MNVPSSPIAKLAAFAVVLAVAFGGGALLGSALGPEPSPAPPSMDHPGPDHSVAP